MILVPELETVVILVPRTGSRSLLNALLATYPKAIQLYRHMEADGVPQGYDRWPRVGVLRRPLDRLFSLYSFLKNSDGGSYKNWPELWQRMQDSVAMSFEDWLVRNELVFTSPYDALGSRFFPQYSVRHPVPENRKSQFVHLRPDLGTDVLQFADLSAVERRLGVSLERQNATMTRPPEMTPAIAAHLERFHQWDLENAL